MKTSIQFFILMMMVSLFTACEEKVVNYGVDYNEERKGINIPIVEEHWDYSFATDDIILWESNKNEIDYRGRHIGKVIKIKNGIRVSEEDHFYKRLNDQVTQLIVLKYDFNKITEPWTCENIFLKRKIKLYNGQNVEVTVDSAVNTSHLQVLAFLKEWESDTKGH